MWCIIIPFLTAIIGAILGWLLRHLTCKCNEDDVAIEIEKNKKLSEELSVCKAEKNSLSSKLSEGELAIESNKKISEELALCRTEKNSLASKLSEELALCKAEKEGLSLKLTDAEASLASGAALGFAAGGDTADVEPELIFDGDAAKAVFGKKIKADDLTVVEGIGPKISELYNNAGISTWYQLSKTPVEKSQEILNGGGSRFLMHKPTSWAKQAGMAFRGEWKELLHLQDILDGGVEKE